MNLFCLDKESFSIIMKEVESLIDKKVDENIIMKKIGTLIKNINLKKNGYI